LRAINLNDTVDTSKVILVDQNDIEIGQVEKLEAHKKGVLHRAFSVFIFNKRNELLLQRRAFGKYHSEGLWTNTCCSHPAPNESTLDAAHRRLSEEMGMSGELKHVFSFIYNEALDNGLIEHELDHVFIGYSEENPRMDENEAIDFKWLSLEDLLVDIKLHPMSYTVWFRRIITHYFSHLTTHLTHESL
jgi:isopentenyl-diphosphate delta-isomerase